MNRIHYEAMGNLNEQHSTECCVSSDVWKAGRTRQMNEAESEGTEEAETGE